MTKESLLFLLAVLFVTEGFAERNFRSEDRRSYVDAPFAVRHNGSTHESDGTRSYTVSVSGSDPDDEFLTMEVPSSSRTTYASSYSADFNLHNGVGVPNNPVTVAWWMKKDTSFGADSRDSSLFQLQSSVGGYVSQLEVLVKYWGDHMVVSVGGTYYGACIRLYWDPASNFVPLTDYHVVIVHGGALDGSDTSLWINGQKVVPTGTVNGGYNGAAADTCRPIFGQWHGSYRFYNGVMDDMHVFQRALSDVEVKQLYQKGPSW